MVINLETPWQRLLAFAAFYIIEGIPQGFTETYLPTHFGKAGLSPEAVGNFGFWDVFPWACKWAIAPFVDIFWTKRKWLLTTQIVMILTLLMLPALTDLKSSFSMITGIIFVHNLFSATQDLAIDAIAVGALPLEEGPSANGAMFAAQEFGSAWGGAVALLVSNAFGYQCGCAFVVATLALIFGCFTLRLHPTVGARDDAHKGVKEQLVAYVRELVGGLGAPQLWVGMAFAAFPSGTIFFRGPHCKTWMVQHGLDEDQVGSVELAGKMLGICTMLVGGFVSARVGPRRMISGSYAGTILVNVVAAQLASPFSLGTWMAVKLAYHFCLGFHVGSQMALFQRLCSPGVAATQFTIFCCLCNKADSWGKDFQGGWIESYGYQKTLMLDSLAVLVPILLLPFVVVKPAKEHAK